MHQEQAMHLGSDPTLAKNQDSSSFFLVVLAKHMIFEAVASIVLGCATVVVTCRLKRDLAWAIWREIGWKIGGNGVGLMFKHCLSETIAFENLVSDSIKIEWDIIGRVETLVVEVLQLVVAADNSFVDLVILAFMGENVVVSTIVIQECCLSWESHDVGGSCPSFFMAQKRNGIGSRRRLNKLQ